MQPHRFSISSSDANASEMRLGHLALAALAGVALYIAVFGFVLERPLTTDVIGMYIKYKEKYLASVSGQQKIAIFAGSNGRYSHRCETIAKQTGIVCANLASAAGFDLRWQMTHYWRYLGKGDVLYMPLEYWPLVVDGAKVGSEAPYIVRHEHRALAMYPISRLPFALFYFDIRFLFSAVGEMILQSAGIERRRVSELAMTVEGDVLGADGAKAIPYRTSLQSLPSTSVDLDAYQDRETIAAVDAIIDTARSKGILVVGGLPTTFTDTVVPDAVVERIKSIFEQRGACFLILPNRSQYPRPAFFDSAYHLRESAQIAHSSAIAPLLGDIFRRGSCLDSIR